MASPSKTFDKLYQDFLDRWIDREERGERIKESEIYSTMQVLLSFLYEDPNYEVSIGESYESLDQAVRHTMNTLELMRKREPRFLKGSESSDLTKQPIAVLSLTEHSIRSLRKNRIHLVSDLIELLVQKTDAEIVKLPGIGKKTLQSIKKALGDQGILPGRPNLK